MTPVRFKRSDGARLTVVHVDRNFVCHGLAQSYPLLVTVVAEGHAPYWCDLDGNEVAPELFEHWEPADEHDQVPPEVIDYIEDAFTSATLNLRCERIEEPEAAS